MRAAAHEAARQSAQLQAARMMLGQQQASSGFWAHPLADFHSAVMLAQRAAAQPSTLAATGPVVQFAGFGS